MNALSRFGGGWSAITAKALRMLVAFAFTCSLAWSAAGFACGWAWADESVDGADGNQPDYSALTLEELNDAVDAKAAECEAAQGRVDGFADRIGEGRMRLDEIDEALPVKKQLAERSVRERYKVQRQYSSLAEVLLCAEDWHSFLAGIEYIAAASKAQISEFVELRAEKADCERTLGELESRKSLVEGELERLQTELEAVTAARDEKQRKAEMVANTHLVADGADWGAGEKAFVDVWAPRLEAYLAGSPLAGQGETFAKAAWDNHIDPRYSAAISNIESGKGRVCIRPHNAWGWGAADSDPHGLASEWPTWEAAINAHARGLSRGYGYAPTPEGAEKYCPFNWEEWYVEVVSGMNSI